MFWSLGSKGLNGRLAFAILASAVGSSFLHGYNTGVVNAPQSLIENFIRTVISERSEGLITPAQVSDSDVTLIWSIAVSIYCVGGMVGGALTGYVANRFGRKGGLLLNNILVFVAAIIQGFAKTASSYEMIIVGRFLIGINNGLNAGLSPMYLAEISPINLRGAVGTVYQLGVTMSILIAQILGLSSVMGTAYLWPFLLGVTIVPAIIQLATLPFCVESPKYILANKGDELEAEEALAWLRGSREVKEEMADMRAENDLAKSSPKVTIKEMLVNPSLRMPLIIAVVIMIAQQFSGINAAMFFSTNIFQMAQLSEANAQLATLLMGLVNVLMTIVSLFLVERCGRKSLLLVGFGGMFIDTVLLTVGLVTIDSNSSSSWVSYCCIVLVLLFVIMFAVGPGSIPWFLVNELFNVSARTTASSIAVSVNWLANFIVGLAFLPLETIIKGYVFIIFAIFQGIFFIFIWRKIPETKNKTVEEISLLFRH